MSRAAATCLIALRCVAQEENPKCPLLIDPSGVYIRGDGAPAAKTFLCGVSPDADDHDPVRRRSVCPLMM